MKTDKHEVEEELVSYRKWVERHTVDERGWMTIDRDELLERLRFAEEAIRERDELLRVRGGKS